MSEPPDDLETAACKEGITGTRRRQAPLGLWPRGSLSRKDAPRGHRHAVSQKHPCPIQPRTVLQQELTDRGNCASVPRVVREISVAG